MAQYQSSDRQLVFLVILNIHSKSAKQNDWRYLDDFEHAAAQHDPELRELRQTHQKNKTYPSTARTKIPK